MSRKQRIYDALSAALTPELLTINDESHRHQVPKGAESHFKVIAISPFFADLNRLARHRLVNTALAEEFKKGLHALSLHLYTAEEWALKTASVPPSPPCSKHLSKKRVEKP